MTNLSRFTSKLPTRTVWIYLVFWVGGSTTISLLHLSHINWLEINTIAELLDLFTAILFAGFALLGLLRLSYKVDIYDDKMISRNLLHKQITFFKDMAGHYVDGSDNNTLMLGKGYFRGVIIKLKNGTHFSLNKAELNNFDTIQKQLRNRCKLLQNQAIKRQIKKEDRKLSFLLIAIIIILVASLMH